jgi:ketoreductase RED2
MTDRTPASGGGTASSQEWTDRPVYEDAMKDRVVLVTGSSRGIGEATARRFAEAGAHLVINSSQSHESGEDVARSLPSAVYKRADVSKEENATGLVDAALAEFGRLDAIVNCAGWSRRVAFDDLDGADEALWRRCLGVHIMGPWYVSRAAAPALRRSDAASITNITSIAATTVSGSSLPYSVAKAGTDHLTKLLAKALAPRIRVNGVAPGFIRTPLTASLPHEYIATYEQTIPVGHGGDPRDIADACFFLATSRFTTGTVLAVDGGVRVR